MIKDYKSGTGYDEVERAGTDTSRDTFFTLYSSCCGYNTWEVAWSSRGKPEAFFDNTA